MKETVELLKSMGLQFEVENNSIRVFCSKGENCRINDQLVKNGISVYNLSSTAKTLEEKFLSLTNESKIIKEVSI
jgi:hypothetical protein